METNRKNYFHNIGLDTEISNKHASVIFFLRSEANTDYTAKVSYTIYYDKSIVTLKLDDFIYSRKSHFHPVKYQLRLHPNRGNTLLTKSLERKRGKKHSALIQYSGSEGFGVIGLEDFQVKRKDGYITLKPHNLFNEKSLSGFDFYFGYDAIARIPAEIASINSCYRDLKKKKMKWDEPSQVFNYFDTCRKTFNRTPLVIKAAMENEATSSFPRDLLICNEKGEFISNLLLHPNKSKTLWLGKALGYRIFERLSPNNEPEKISIRHFTTESAQITLSPREQGTIKIDTKDHKEAGQFVTKVIITDQKDPRGVSVAKSLSTYNKKLFHLSPNSFLIEKWPLELRLPRSSYNISIARGVYGPSQTFQINLESKPSHEIKFSIPTQKDKTARNFNYTFGSINNSNPLVKFASNNEGLRRILETDVNAVYITSLNQYQEAKERGLIPILKVIDTNKSISLNLFPVTHDFIEKWESKREGLTSFIHESFVSFAHQEAPESLLEIGCPGVKLAIEEYQTYLTKYKPDAAQIFGCRNQFFQNDLLRTLGSIHTDRDKNILITTSFSEEGLSHLNSFPKLIFPKKSEEPISSVIKSGNYSIASSDAKIILEKIVKNSKSSLPSNRNQMVTINLKSKGQDRPTNLIIYNEKNIIENISLSRSKKDRSITFPLSLDKKTKWIRIELRGQKRLYPFDKEKIDEYVLATTNFVKIQ